MRRSELHAKLQQIYTLEKEMGVVKPIENGYQNTFFVVPPPPPIVLDETLPYPIISKALKSMSSLPSYNEMSEVDRLVQYLFVKREAIESSRLEGTWSTIDHALTPTDILNEEKENNEHASIRSYAKIIENLMDQIQEKKEEAINLELIKKIHFEITKNDPQTKGPSGEIRKHYVQIGGLYRIENSKYNPCPPEYINQKLNEVIKWLSNRDFAEKADAGMGLSLPIRLAIGHSHFEAVHPFADGNGRTGRALWPIQMVAAGFSPLYLSGFVEVNKRDYIDSLEQAQKKLKYSPIIEFLSTAIIESYLENKKTKYEILRLPKKWKERGNFRKNSAGERCLELLIKYPIITSKVIEEELNISAPAAARALKQLVHGKIIIERPKEKRKKVYAAEEVIQLLSKSFDTDPIFALEKAYRLLQLD